MPEPALATGPQMPTPDRCDGVPGTPRDGLRVSEGMQE
jgi:hypothetical protein